MSTSVHSSRFIPFSMAQYVYFVRGVERKPSMIIDSPVKAYCGPCAACLTLGTHCQAPRTMQKATKER
ncbi:MAG: hypothetical protein K8H99_13065, partial [Nitrospirae bacterium]|nr:hypothetical protein [Fimbriimonadaceae bacterium]